MMRKTLCWLLACFLFVLNLLPRFVLAEDGNVIHGNTRLKYAVSDKYLWTIDENGRVAHYDLQKMIKEDITQLDNVENVAAGTNHLFVTLKENDRLSVASIGDDTTELKVYPIDADIHIKQIEAGNGWIYFLGSQGEDKGNYSVYRAEPYGFRYIEELNIAGWSNQNITAIGLWGNKLCAYSALTKQLVLVDVEQLTMIGESVTVANLSYIVPGDTVNTELHVYALSDPSIENGVWDINMTTGNVSRMSTVLPGDAAGLRRSRTHLFTVADGYTSIYQQAIVQEVQNSSASRTLTLVNWFDDVAAPTNRMATAMDKFSQRYPDVSITNVTVDDYRVLVTNMMAGASGYDVLCFQENMLSVPTNIIYKSGALEDLEKYQCIQTMLDGYDDVLDPFRISEHLYGMPVFYWPYTWKLNVDLEEQLGITVPRMGWTWDDFFDLAEKVVAYNSCNKDQIYLLNDQIDVLPYFLTQYSANTIDVMSGTADYGNAEFIRLLGRWTDLCQKGLIAFNTGEEMTAALLSTQDEGYYAMSGTIIMPPVFDEATRYPAQCTYGCINANSNMKEEAAYFMACYFDTAVMNDMMVVYNCGYLMKEELRHMDILRISDENQMVWQSMLRNAVQKYYIGDLYKDQWQNLYPKLVSGEITPEQYAQTCQRRAEMVLGE